MNCERAQQLLLAGPDAALPGALRDALQAHLAVCPICRRERERLAQLDQALVDYVVAAPSGSVQAAKRQFRTPQMQRRIKVRRVASAVGRGMQTVTVRGAAVLAVVVLLISLGVGFGLAPARTLVQLGLSPFAMHEPTLPVLPIVGDQIWVERVSPRDGALLQAHVPFEVQLGYTLVSAPEALVSLRLAPDTGQPTRYFTTPVRVAAGTNRVSVRFILDAARARELLELDTVQLEVLLRATTGEAPMLARTTAGRWVVAR